MCLSPELPTKRPRGQLAFLFQGRKKCGMLGNRGVNSEGAWEPGGVSALALQAAAASRQELSEGTRAAKPSRQSSNL